MKKTKLITSLFGLIAAATAGAATVSPTDPVPNTDDPVTFEPIDGGVRYVWTVNMGADDKADLQGSVGAWSWDEDSFPETAKGWTHTSNWVALRLTKSAKVTFRLFRKENVPVEGGGVAGNILYPAFTLYRNWDGDGGDKHTYNNRGNVEWAEDLEYLTHVENVNGATNSQLTIELPAGLYSIALGGNSPSTNREPAQGYGFEVTTKSLPSPAIKLRKTPRLTSADSAPVSGRVTNSEDAKRIQVMRGGKRSMVAIRKSGFSTMISDLEPGRNVVWLMLESKEGKIVDRKRVVIERTMPLITGRSGRGRP